MAYCQPLRSLEIHCSNNHPHNNYLARRQVLEPKAMRTPAGQNFPPERVRKIRMSLGMTLKEAGARAGVNMNVWSRWERDEKLKTAQRPNPSACMILEKMEVEGRYGNLRREREKGG